jgi:hypothetical protein
VFSTTRIVQYVYPTGQTDEFAKNNLHRIEKPNGLEQLGSSIRWKKLALFVKILAVKNLSEASPQTDE